MSLAITILASILLVLLSLLVGTSFKGIIGNWKNTAKDDKIAFLCVVALAIPVTITLLATNTYKAQQDAAQAFDEGKMVKVVTYKSKAVDGKVIKIDSTYTYKKKRE